MTTPPDRRLRGTGDLLVTTLLAAQVLRLLSSLVGGFAAIGQHDEFGPPGRFHTGLVLTSFGEFGDGVGVLLLLIAAVIVWWRRTAPSLADGPALPWHTSALTSLLALTALGGGLAAVGAALQASVTGLAVGARLSAEVGLQVAHVVIALGALVAVRRLDSPRDDAAIGDEPGDAPAAVFAVDRKTGDVLAWRSRSEAHAKAPLYGVEDDEFDWFLDDGAVLRATAADGDVTLTATGEERPDDLLRHLKEYSGRRGIVIDDDDEDEPLAYVDPIARDHYLEMWPGWLRWLGRLAR
ncbi:MAG TPA: hypothetical protein VFJ17_00440 [Mycobacteriales bacterium]|jgi:hypothetical protein|nr:hypothetical protein [Mycobacteriales bacterium]